MADAPSHHLGSLSPTSIVGQNTRQRPWGEQEDLQELNDISAPRRPAEGLKTFRGLKVYRLSS